MINDDFVKSCIDPEIGKECDFHFVQYNLDNIDMNLPSILVGLDKLYPINSRFRNELEAGDKILSVLLKSNDLYPVKGIVFIIMSEPQQMASVESKGYIVFCINVTNLRSKDTIEKACFVISKELYKYYGDNEKRYGSIFRKFINIDFSKDTMNTQLTLQDIMEGDYTPIGKD